jgi:hypothetical protein
MQNTKSYYVVTDGESVVGSFTTASAADSFLRGGKHRNLNGQWVSLKEAGFYISIRS